MKKMSMVFICLLAVFSLSVTGFAKEPEKETLGEKLFKKHCSKCHPNGSNIVNPQKPLGKKEREANKVMTADDIVKLMRSPGPGMVKFGDKVISEKEAKAIAGYVVKTYK